MTKFNRARMRHGLRWKSNNPPPSHWLKRLVVIIIVALIVTLLYPRRDTNDAQREVQHLSDTTAHLLNGGAVQMGDAVINCKVTLPAELEAADQQRPPI